MVPERILAKMRLSAGSAGLVLLLSGCGASEPAAPRNAPAPEPAKPAATAPTPEAKPTVQATEPKAAAPVVAKPIPNQIQTVKPKQCADPCPACGMG